MRRLLNSQVSRVRQTLYTQSRPGQPENRSRNCTWRGEIQVAPNRVPRHRNEQTWCLPITSQWVRRVNVMEGRQWEKEVDWMRWKHRQTEIGHSNETPMLVQELVNILNTAHLGSSLRSCYWADRHDKG